LLGKTDRTLINLKAAKQTKPNPKEVFAFALGDQVRFEAKEIR
jgi:hypothetical protein